MTEGIHLYTGNWTKSHFLPHPANPWKGGGNLYPCNEHLVPGSLKRLFLWVMGKMTQCMAFSAWMECLISLGKWGKLARRCRNMARLS